MARRVIVSFDDVITAITDDVRVALIEAAQTLLSGTGREGTKGLEEAYFGDTSQFEYLDAIGAMPTRLMLLRAVALEAKAFSSISISVHQVDSRPGWARVMARTNLMSAKAADHAFKALRDIHDGTRDEEDALRTLHAGIKASCGDRLRHYGESSRDEVAAKIMGELREEQDWFGPAQGHPLRIIPDYGAGVSERQLLESLPERVVERVRGLVAEMGMASPKP